MSDTSVLLVLNDAHFLDEIKKRLTAVGYHVETVPGFNAALMQMDVSSFDLYVFELEMADALGHNELDLVRICRGLPWATDPSKASPGVIMLVNDLSDPALTTAPALEVTTCLKKPISVEALTKALLELDESVAPAAVLERTKTHE